MQPWHILGIGAIGSLWACALHASQPRLILSARRPEKHQPQITLTLESNSRVQDYSFAVAADDEPIQRLLVCTKAYAVLPALRAIAKRIESRASIVLLVNGMGYHDKACALLPDAELFAASTTDGAWLKGANHVVHAGQGETQIAAYSHNADTQQLLETLQAPRLTIKAHNDARELLLQKLCINAAINGLTLIHDCRNGALQQEATLAEAVTQLCTESSTILHASGYPALAESMAERVETVIQQTAQNYSSSCMDRRQKRRSEVAWFNGYLCTMAAQQGLDAPHNQAILDRVNTIEQGYV